MPVAGGNFSPILYSFVLRCRIHFLVCIASCFFFLMYYSTSSACLIFLSTSSIFILSEWRAGDSSWVEARSGVLQPTLYLYRTLMNLSIFKPEMSGCKQALNVTILMVSGRRHNIFSHRHPTCRRHNFILSLRHDVPMVIPHVYAETSKCWLGVACVLDKDKYERPSCSRTNGCAGRRRDNMVDIMEDGKPERYMCWNLCLSVSEGGVQKQIIGRLCYTREIYFRCVIRYATSYTHWNYARPLSFLIEILRGITIRRAFITWVSPTNDKEEHAKNHRACHMFHRWHRWVDSFKEPPIAARSWPAATILSAGACNNEGKQQKWDGKTLTHVFSLCARLIFCWCHGS